MKTYDLIIESFWKNGSKRILIFDKKKYYYTEWFNRYDDRIKNGNKKKNKKFCLKYPKNNYFEAGKNCIFISNIKISLGFKVFIRSLSDKNGIVKYFKKKNEFKTYSEIDSVLGMNLYGIYRKEPLYLTCDEQKINHLYNIYKILSGYNICSAPLSIFKSIIKIKDRHSIFNHVLMEGYGIIVEKVVPEKIIYNHDEVLKWVKYVKKVCNKHKIYRKGKTTEYSSSFDILNPYKYNFYCTKNGFKLIDIDTEWEME